MTSFFVADAIIVHTGISIFKK
ncbi:hypothetical protein NC652_012864 [Populus alba x Populus x berolinensis]|nr:hypothetical protein NC652_012864 [Populus alba x Populus x berolinensis]